MEMMLAGVGEEGAEVGEVEVAGGGFELLPVDGGFEGVEAEVLGGGPDLVEHGGPGAGVVDLGAEHEVGLAVDEEGGVAVLVDDAGEFGVWGFGSGSFWGGRRYCGLGLKRGG